MCIGEKCVCNGPQPATDKGIPVSYKWRPDLYLDGILCKKYYMIMVVKIALHQRWFSPGSFVCLKEDCACIVAWRSDGVNGFSELAADSIWCREGDIKLTSKPEKRSVILPVMHNDILVCVMKTLYLAWNNRHEDMYSEPNSFISRRAASSQGHCQRCHVFWIVYSCKDNRISADIIWKYDHMWRQMRIIVQKYKSVSKETEPR